MLTGAGMRDTVMSSQICVWAAMLCAAHWFAPQVDKCHAERELFRAQKRAKGWSEQRIYDAVHKLKQKQQRQEENFSWAGNTSLRWEALTIMLSVFLTT